MHEEIVAMCYEPRIVININQNHYNFGSEVEKSSTINCICQPWVPGKTVE